MPFFARTEKEINMKKTRTLAILLVLMLALSMSALASGEASGGMAAGPASLTWEQSADLSRASAELWQDEGESAYAGGVILSDENDYTAIFAEGGVMTVADYTIATTGREAQSPNTTMHFADANFYGTGAAVLAGEGGELTMSDSSIVTTGEGANGVFTYGGTIWLEDVHIACFGKENAHGVDAVQNGAIYGENIWVYTSGINSGVAATDTGGGYIELKDSTLISAMAPGVYMDGQGVSLFENVTVQVGFDKDGSPVTEMYMTNSGADGVAEEMKENTAEGLVMTGDGQITAIDTDVTAPYGVKFHSQSSTTQIGILSMTGGSITSTAYDVLYVTGANGSGVLDGVDCTVAEGRYLIRICNLVPANLAEPGVGAKICAGTGDFTLRGGSYEGDAWALNAEEEATWGAQLEDASRYDNSLKLCIEDANWTGAAIHVNELALADGAVWTPAGESDIALLTVEKGAEIQLSADMSVTVNGEAVTDLGEGVYENVSIV